LKNFPSWIDIAVAVIIVLLEVLSLALSSYFGAITVIRENSIASGNVRILLALLVVAYFIVRAYQTYQNQIKIIDKFEEWKHNFTRPVETALNEALQSIVDGVITFPPSDAKARSCLLLLSVNSKECLSIAFYNGDFSPHEKKLCFQQRAGLAGHVWEFKKVAIADLDAITADELEMIWKLHPDEIQHTKHLKSILAVPVFIDGDVEQFIGVLAVDSIYPLPISKLNDLTIAQKIREAAALAAQTLKICKLLGIKLPAT
jgi:GAF domain-containing protein